MGSMFSASGSAATSANSEDDTTSANTAAGAGCAGLSNAMSCVALARCSVVTASGAGTARRADHHRRQCTRLQGGKTTHAPRCSDSKRDSTCPRLGSLKLARPKRSPDLDATQRAASVRTPQVASCCCALYMVRGCASVRMRDKQGAKTHRSSRAAFLASFTSSAAVSAFAAASAASTGLSAAVKNADQDRPFSSPKTAARRAPSFSATKHMSSYARCCGAAKREPNTERSASGRTCANTSSVCKVSACRSAALISVLSTRGETAGG